jgi:hypothetical protein
MGIIKPLTKQHPQTALGANFRTMHGLEADETTIGGEAKVGVGTSQARQSIKCYAIHSNEDRSRELGLWIELDPVGVVIIRHIKLNYPSLSKPLILLYLWNGAGSIAEGDVIWYPGRGREVRTLGWQR